MDRIIEAFEDLPRDGKEDGQSGDDYTDCTLAWLELKFTRKNEDEDIHCECGPIQTTIHLLQCPLGPTCTQMICLSEISLPLTWPGPGLELYESIFLSKLLIF